MTNHHQTTSRRGTGSPSQGRTAPPGNARQRTTRQRVAAPRRSSGNPVATSAADTRSRPPSGPVARRRRRAWWTAAPIAAVVVVVVILVAVAAGSSSPPRASGLSVGSPTGSGAGSVIGSGVVPASASVQVAVSAVSQATLRGVGTPPGLVRPTPVIGDHALLAGAEGKPEVLYVGAEYCPYCAAQRWPLAVALSHFGTFTGLGTTHSSTSDVYPDTNTLSFYGSTYMSPVLDFSPVELATNQAVGGQYPSLQKLTPSQQSVLDAYDRAPYTSQPGAIPFIDIGNGAVMIGASYDPAVLQGKSAAQIADALSHPSSAIAHAVDGTANLLVSAITRATGLRPIR